MALAVDALVTDAAAPADVAAFWSGLLGWSTRREDDGAARVVGADPADVDLLLVRGAAPRHGPDAFHLDLTSTSPDDQRQRVATALVLGGSHLDVGQGPDVEHVVLADPEGSALCVIEPGNAFLADCGLVGALSGDGSAAVGRFWSAALGWPLVWDQDEETAVRSPLGGPKITWGGPPFDPATGQERVRLRLSSSDLTADLERLVALGATRVDGAGGVVTLLEPDGRRFEVVTGTQQGQGNEGFVAGPA